MKLPFSRAIRLIFALAPVFLSSCVNPGLTGSNNRYTDDFASLADRQLLLNLARLANDEPAYFIQLGAFTASYTYGATGGIGSGSSFTRNYGKGESATTTTTDTYGSPTSTGNGPVTGATVATALPTLPSGTLTVAAPSVGVSISASPTFSFVPLSGDGVAKALFNPLPNNVFSLIFSNWHGDIALRTAVQSITLMPPSPAIADSDPAELRVEGATVDLPFPAPESTETAHASDSFFFVEQPKSPDQVKVGAAASRDPESFTVKTSKTAAKFQWQVSSDGGWKWKAISDGPAAENGAAAHSGPVYAGTTTETLRVYRIGADMAGYRFRCEATEDVSGEKPIRLVNDPRQESYPTFLALAYEVQRAQVDGKIPSPIKSQAERDRAKQEEKEAQAQGITVYDIKLPDIVSAQTSGYSVLEVPNDPRSGKHHAYVLYKKPAAADNTLDAPFADEKDLVDYPLLHWIVRNHWSLTCSLRSFDRILYECAMEEQRFRDVAPGTSSRFPFSTNWVGSKNKLTEAKGFPSIEVVRGYKASDGDSDEQVYKDGEKTWDKFGPSVTVFVDDESAKTERFHARAILRSSGFDYKPDYDIANVPYVLGKEKVTYVIGDCRDEFPGRERGIWTPSIPNETEFTLLSYLFTQASIDSSKLVAQQLVNVH